MKSEVCNFADDNTLYACNINLSVVIDALTSDAFNMLHWFKINSMKANPTKFQFMVLGNKPRPKTFLTLDSVSLTESTHVTLLGVDIDNKLIFNQHIDKLCTRASFKLHALRRLRPYLSEEKAKVLSTSFIKCQFIYAPLIWMFCNKTNYKKIERVHHKTLKVVYDIDTDYGNILKLYKEKSVHQYHLKILVIEIFKSIMNLNPEFMWSFFQFNSNQLIYDLRRGPALILPKARTVTYGTNSVLYQGCWTWNNLPRYTKENVSIEDFVKNVDALNYIKCSCKICKKF